MKLFAPIQPRLTKGFNPRCLGAGLPYMFMQIHSGVLAYCMWRDKMDFYFSHLITVNLDLYIMFRSIFILSQC